jgi:hypothetical protein
MVMAQIPALFLPKRGVDEQKPSVNKPVPKKRNFKKKEDKQTNCVASLLKGKFDGHEKNNGEVFSRTAR